MRTSRLAWSLFFAAMPLASTVAKETPAGAEAKLKSEAATEIAAFVTACAQGGAKSEGAKALAEGRALDTAAVVAAEKLLVGVADDSADAATAAAAARKTTGPKIAKVYDKLSLLDHDAKVAARFEAYLFAAIRWEPTKGRLGRAQKAVDDAARANRTEEAGRLLTRLKRANAEGAAAGHYDKLELELATKDFCLLGSTVNELVAWVSLPRDWAKGKSYPILVGVDGAGSNFLGYGRGSKGARASRSAILVCPCTFSNTNELKPEAYPMYDPALLTEWTAKRIEFDGKGVDGVLDVVRKRFGGEDKIFVTGFSGGGNYTYFKLLSDPAHVRGACPACANFSGMGTEGAPGAGDDGGPIVQLLTGAVDPYKDSVNGQPGIEAQTDAAQKALDGLRYTRVTRIMVPGAGHDALHGKVWEFFDRVVSGK